jgi:hypothetical protein
MLLGATTFSTLKTHPGLLDISKYTSLGVLTLEQMMKIFEKKIVVGGAVYADQDGTMHDVWSDCCILAYVPPAPPQTGALPNNQPLTNSTEEPAFGYTLRLEGYPQTDTYIESGGKINLVRCTDFTRAKITGSSAGYQFLDCV